MAEPQRIEKAERQLRRFSEAIASGKLEPVRRLLASLSPAEIGHLLESLPLARRYLVWELVDTEQDGEVLVHVNDEVRSGLIRETEPEELIAAATEMDLDDLADIIDDLPETVTSSVLLSMDRENRQRLEQVLSHPEDTAGGLMDPDVVTVRADVTLDVVLRYLRIRGELPELTDHLFVVDRAGHYLGRLSVANIVTKDPATPVANLVDRSLPAFQVETPDTDVAHDFENYDIVSAPVIDAHNQLLGRITVDDVVDVIREDAEHSMMSIAGLDEEDDMFAPATQSARRRGIWLGVNAIAALIVAWFIRHFEATLDQVVALAVLMPVVASMGGIAGSQSMTLMIRGLAMGQVGTGNTRELIGKEIAVGILNGVTWAIVLAAVVALWFQQIDLALVVAGALSVNLIVSAAAGATIPVVLKRVGIDPALAGGVVLITVTDVIGFVAFLGLGTVFLLG